MQSLFNRRIERKERTAAQAQRHSDGGFDKSEQQRRFDNYRTPVPGAHSREEMPVAKINADDILAGRPQRKRKETRRHGVIG